MSHITVRIQIYSPKFRSVHNHVDQLCPPILPSPVSDIPVGVLVLDLQKLTGRIDQRTDRSGRVASPSVLRAKDPYSLALRTRKTRDSKLLLRKIPKEDLPAPSSVSAAFPASWLLLEYEDGCLAGCPHLTGSRIFKSSTSSDQMMYNTCNSITDD